MSPDEMRERNREAMRLFEKCINTNDIELGRKLIAETAAFKTPVSPTPLYGADGYLSVVSFHDAYVTDARFSVRSRPKVARQNKRYFILVYIKINDHLFW